MKSKITTFFLFIIMLILIAGIIIFGRAIYLDLTGSDSKQVAYNVKTIETEEPTENTNNDNNVVNVNTQSLIGKISSIFSKNNQSHNSELYAYNEDLENKYFYKQLSENQKNIYNGIYNNKEHLKEGNYVINYGDAFTDILALEKGSEILGDDYQTAMEAFSHDNPDIFYIDVNKMFLNIETKTKIFKTTYNVYISPAVGETYLSKDFKTEKELDVAIEQIESNVNNILNTLNGNEYEKIRQIHDTLIANIEYDESIQAVGTYSIYGALVKNECVCEGYAKAFKVLTNRIGIECEIMQGTATNNRGETETHAWNCIKLNDKWYQIDVTWDDPIILVNKKRISNNTRYNYFLKGTAAFEKDHFVQYNFSEGGKKFIYPDLSIKDYKN